MIKSQFGVLGLGVMGQNLALNIADQGYRLAVYNRLATGEENIVPDFLKKVSPQHTVEGFSALPAFIEQLERPRKILIMVKAGNALDQILDQILPLLEPGDILLDGGNSHYHDTQRRQAQLQGTGVHWLGVGISGGEEGARNGAAIMPGGERSAYDQVAPILESLAAPARGGRVTELPCCSYIGSGGSGHFVKMIHNGIEYAEMQLLAEVYLLLKTQMNYEAIAHLLEQWNQQERHASYLLEITIQILRKRAGNGYLLDFILDKAGNKGTGAWSSRAAMELGFPATMMTGAVYARYISSFWEARQRLGEYGRQPQGGRLPSVKELEESYAFARQINHWQGFSLIRSASNHYQWHLRLAELARIWTNGCIIRSGLMEQLSTLLEEGPLSENTSFLQSISEKEGAVPSLLKAGLDHRLHLPVFHAAYQYWVGMTSPRGSAQVIQAQRDFFGAHQYQRIDREHTEFFHTNWLEL
ncbi:MAG: NADP-dependent phosphogluconate dehydrogenase [Bacteroidota bacterium]